MIVFRSTLFLDFHSNTDFDELGASADCTPSMNGVFLKGRSEQGTDSCREEKYKLRALRHTDLISDSSGGQRSDMGLIWLESKCQWVCSASRGFGGESVSRPFPEFFNLQLFPSSSEPQHSKFRYLFLLSHLPSCLPLVRTLVITLGPPG